MSFSYYLAAEGMTPPYSRFSHPLQAAAANEVRGEQGNSEHDDILSHVSFYQILRWGGDTYRKCRSISVSVHGRAMYPQRNPATQMLRRLR